MSQTYRTHTYRSALVTGASSGIGESLARILAGRGAELVLVARREDLLDALADDLRRTYRVGVEVMAADLTDGAELAAVERRLRERPVELLVNNAGYGAFGAFADLPLDDQLKEIGLNVTALVRLCHAALPAMIERGHGGILNVASVAAFAPSPGSATYAATKAYVASFGESLYTEVREAGVSVTTLCPGFTRTDEETAAGLLWLRRDDVARAGLDAVTSGRPQCVPGLRYKAVMPALRLVPRSLARTAAKRLWRLAADSHST